MIESRLARDREAREKELGVSLKDAKAILDAHKKRIEGEKTDFQKAQEERDAYKQELDGYKLKDAIQSSLLEAGANPKMLAKLSLRVIGDTPEEIAKDVAELKKDFPAMFGNYSGSGGGHPGVQDGGAATPRVYRASEIRGMSHQERIANEKDIIRAMNTPGGIIQD